MKAISFLVLGLLSSAWGAPNRDKRQAQAPSVQLSYAKVVGSSLSGVDSFKGIPFAKPPVGPLRLKPPQPVTANLGTVNAVGVPVACPQFLIQANLSALPQGVIGQLLNTPFLQAATVSGEDCLTINVHKPSTATASSKLPVLFWIYGGGFEFGSTQLYDGSSLISTSISQNKPIVFVAVNYRIGGFGFLGGKQIKQDGSSNLGLLDQRLGLQWVADNIAKFGGDPDKVTIWGESAGSASVFDQLALYNGDNTYKGKPLFRGAIMDSGSIVPAEPVDSSRAQAVYDAVVFTAGCSSAADTLACLRSLSYTTFLNAVNSVPSLLSYTSTALKYLPRPDGTVLTQSPHILAKNGAYAKVPFIIGDQQDEGTLFSLAQSNLTTTNDLVDYFATIFYPQSPRSVSAGLVATYPDNQAAGSPFGTGPFNAIYPQYKRLAAILGDVTFTLARRAFLGYATSVAPNVPSWSYLGTYGTGIPVLGTFHATDLLPAFGDIPGPPTNTIQAYYLSFVNTLDPNQGTTGLPNWPLWKTGKQLLNIQALTNTFITDDFRASSGNFFLQNIDALAV